MGTVLRPAEVARELRISRVTVYELIRRGELPATRVGHQFRIEASALATYRAEHHEGARPAQATRQGTLVIRAEDHIVTLSVPDDLESLPWSSWRRRSRDARVCSGPAIAACCSTPS